MGSGIAQALDTCTDNDDKRVIKRIKVMLMEE